MDYMFAAINRHNDRHGPTVRVYDRCRNLYSKARFLRHY